MLGWGQPLHAFDAGKIRGDKLIARRARNATRIVTLDGVERTLDGEMLVIADVERPLVIAGVFGSVDAEVDERTTDLVLEAANFSGPEHLRTEMHTGIRSEASNRFEKGLDANLGRLSGFLLAAPGRPLRGHGRAGHGRCGQRAVRAAARALSAGEVRRPARLRRSRRPSRPRRCVVSSVTSTKAPARPASAPHRRRSSGR